MAEDIGTKIRKGAYGLAKLVKEEAQVVGKAVGEGLDAASEKLGTAVDRVKQFHADIQNQGGYLEPVRRTWRQTSLRTLAIYKDLEDAATTEGEYDPQKIKGLLKNKGQTIAKFGQRTYDKLAKIVTEGVQAIKQDYERFIPTEEELNTKYRGIGTLNKEILFRDEYDSCLALCQQIKQTLPKGTRYKARILNDAKAYGVGSPQDLRNIYSMQQTDDLINQRQPKHDLQEKMRVLEKYFPM